MSERLSPEESTEEAALIQLVADQFAKEHRRFRPAAEDYETASTELDGLREKHGPETVDFLRVVFEKGQEVKKAVGGSKLFKRLEQELTLLMGQAERAIRRAIRDTEAMVGPLQPDQKETLVRKMLSVGIRRLKEEILEDSDILQMFEQRRDALEQALGEIDEAELMEPMAKLVLLMLEEEK